MLILRLNKKQHILMFTWRVNLTDTFLVLKARTSISGKFMCQYPTFPELDLVYFFLLPHSDW